MQTFLADGLIIANPAISDMPKFSDIAGRAIYIVEHSTEGGIGVSLNQNFSMPLEEIADNLPILNKLRADYLLTPKVISGGPLEADTPWILGRKSEVFEKQFSTSSLALNFSDESFKNNKPEHAGICGIGSFGWGPGKLENELANNLWHYFPTTEEALSSIPFPDAIRAASQLLLTMKF